MTDQNHSNDYRPEDAKRRVSETDALGRELDAALAKYAAVEPRAGLEARVLAHLHGERERSSAHGPWGWRQVTALAAAGMILAAALVWISGKRTQAVRHESAATPHTQVASSDVNRPEKSQVPATIEASVPGAPHARDVSRTMARTVPKLEQFPSPHPLSEQEQLLANYIAQYPEHALLVARALADPLQPDQLKEIPHFPSGDERDNDTTVR